MERHLFSQLSAEPVTRNQESKPAEELKDQSHRKLLRVLQHASDRGNHLLEFRELNSQLLPSRTGERVIASATVRLRHLPFGFYPPLHQQSLQRGIQRPFFNREYLIGKLFDGLRDSIAVQWRARERLEDKHVEGAGEQIGLLRHGSYI